MKTTSLLFFLLFFGGQVLSQISIVQISRYGGLNEQYASGVRVSNGFLYVSGYDGSVYPANDVQSMLLKYPVDDISALTWKIIWPDVPGYSGYANAEVFMGIAVTGTAIYADGQSWSQTVDNIGDKESKPVVCKFPLDGAMGHDTGGAVWIAKPEFFPSYQGIECLLDLIVNPEPEGDFLYACGYAQSNGLNNTAILAKYDTLGNLLWFRILDNTGVGYGSCAYSIAILNDNIYTAGHLQLQDSDPHMKFWKHDPSGGLIWEKYAETDVYSLSYAICSSDQHFYITGTEINPDNGHDVVVLKFDEEGNLVWKTTWGGSSDDIANGIEVMNDKLIVVGETSSFGAGGKDAFVLEMNGSDGSTEAYKVYGGAMDDAGINICKNSGTSAFIVGSFEGDARFDTLVLHSSDNRDLFILEITISPSGIPEAVHQTVLLYPNPARDYLTVEIKGNDIHENLTLSLYTSLGGKVKEMPVNTSARNIQLEGLTAGMYFYRLSGETTILHTGKIIIE